MIYSFVILLAILMFPYRTEGRGDRQIIATPVVCFLLLFLHVVLVLFVFRDEKAAGSVMLSFFQYGVLPSDFRWYTPVTALFLHVDFVHVIGNAYVLWLYGSAVERRIGWPLFIVIFIATGYTGIFGYMAMSESYLSHIPSIGASTAVAGMMGAVMLIVPSARVVFFSVVPPHRFFIPAGILIVPWLGGQILYGFSSIDDTQVAVNHWAHVFGFIGGVLAGLVCRYFVISREKVTEIRQSDGLAAVFKHYNTGQVGAAESALVELLRDKNEMTHGERVEKLRIGFVKGRQEESVQEGIRICEDSMVGDDHESFLQAFALIEHFAPDEQLPIEMYRTAAHAFELRHNHHDALRCRLRQLILCTEDNQRERILFQLGTLAVDKLSDWDLARDTLTHCIQAYPQGPMAKEADFLLTRRLPALVEKAGLR